MKTIDNFVSEMEAFCGKTAEGKLWMRIAMKVKSAVLMDGAEYPIPCPQAKGVYRFFVDGPEIPSMIQQFNSVTPDVKNGVSHWVLIKTQVPELFRYYFDNFGYDVWFGSTNWTEPHILTKDGKPLLDKDDKYYQADNITFGYIVDSKKDGSHIRGCEQDMLRSIEQEWVPKSLPSTSEQELDKLFGEKKTTSTEDVDIPMSPKKSRSKKNGQKSEEK